MHAEVVLMKQFCLASPVSAQNSPVELLDTAGEIDDRAQDAKRPASPLFGRPRFLQNEINVELAVRTLCRNSALPRVALPQRTWGSATDGKAKARRTIGVVLNSYLTLAFPVLKMAKYHTRVIIPAPKVSELI